MQELMSATGQDIHTIEIWDALVGLTLDQAAKLVQKSLIVGVLRSRQSAAADVSSGEDSRLTPTLTLTLTPTLTPTLTLTLTLPLSVQAALGRPELHGCDMLDYGSGSGIAMP